MPNELLERANRAIAESQRLIDQLCVAMRKAQQLDHWLDEIHWRRVEQERSKKVA
jgi:hypothetical protein